MFLHTNTTLIRLNIAFYENYEYYGKFYLKEFVLGNAYKICQNMYLYNVTSSTVGNTFIQKFTFYK